MKKLLTLLLASTIILSGCGGEDSTSPEENSQPVQSLPKEVEVTTIRDIIFTPTVTRSGRIQTASSIPVIAKESGYIEELSVVEGTSIEKNNTIATLDPRANSNPLILQLTNISTSLANTQQNYFLAKRSFDEQLKNSQISIENARLQEKQAKENLEETINQGANDIEQAVINLDNALAQSGLSQTTSSTSIKQAEERLAQTKVDKEEQIRSFQDQTEIALVQQSAFLRDFLRTIDRYIGEEPTSQSFNDEFEGYVGILNKQVENDLRNTYIKAREALKTHEETNFSSLSEELDSLENISFIVRDGITLLDSFVDNSIYDSIFTLSDLNNLKAQVDTLQTGANNIHSVVRTIQQTRQQLTDIIRNTDDAVLNAEIALEQAIAQGNAQSQISTDFDEPLSVRTARSQLESTRTRVTSANVQARQRVESASLNIESAKTQYANLEASSSQQLQNIQAQIDQLKGERAILRERLSQFSITAPIAGTVTNVSVETGDYVQGGSTIATISQTEELTILVELSSDDLATLELSEVMINNINAELIGNPSVLNNSGKTVLEYKIDEDAQLLSGERVEVTFALLENDALFIPLQSVTITPDARFVFVVSDNQLVQKTVETGLVVDTMVAITDGLDGTETLVTGKIPGLEEGTEITPIYVTE